VHLIYKVETFYLQVDYRVWILSSIYFIIKRWNFIRL